jgi:hypothetical protein
VDQVRPAPLAVTVQMVLMALMANQVLRDNQDQ